MKVNVIQKDDINHFDGTQSQGARTTGKGFREEKIPS